MKGKPDMVAILGIRHGVIPQPNFDKVVEQIGNKPLTEETVELLMEASRKDFKALFDHLEYYDVLSNEKGSL